MNIPKISTPNYNNNNNNINFKSKIVATKYMQDLFSEKTNKVAQPKLAIDKILSCVVPIPPINEQIRIVKSIKYLLSITEKAEI